MFTYSLYMTSEPEAKIKSLYANAKNYFILDVQAFIKNLHIDMDKPISIYIANDEIQNLILTQLKMKKFKGVIYINKNISAELVDTFKKCLGKKCKIKYILIDNGQFPKHLDILDNFDEVIFYERFRKNVIGQKVSL